MRELRAMVAQYGLEVVQSYMRHVQDNAEESVRRVITKLKDGAFALPLDNGAVIRVAIRVDAAGRSAEIDFTGTSPQLTNNFNAPTAVCMAAVLYVFRTLVADEIPLNAGCMKPLKVIIPERSMLNPEPPASVVAGNVETSTCITNALYGALGTMGSSQGTMNNFTFGNERHQYYETISGGSGAGEGFAGTSVVQTHMTNSRLTDPEVLEFRFPVRLDSYAIRPGSGGSGRWNGGDGAVRRVRFLEPMTASILSNNRHQGAFGAQGGGAGLPGINRVERADGSVVAARPHRLDRDGPGRRLRDRVARRRQLRRGGAGVAVRMSPWRSCLPMLHRLAAVLSVAAAPALAAEPTVLERPLPLPVAAAAAGSAPAKPWQVVGLPQQTKPFTRFSVAQIDGVQALRIEADQSYGNLVHPLRVGASSLKLSWQWRVDRPIAPPT